MHHTCRNAHLVLRESTHTVVSDAVALARIQERRRAQAEADAMEATPSPRIRDLLTLGALMVAATVYAASALGAL